MSHNRDVVGSLLGVKPAEVMLSHVITQFLVLIVQVGLLLLCTFTVFQVPFGVYLYIRLCLYIHHLPGTVRCISIHSPMFVHSPSSRYRAVYICTFAYVCTFTVFQVPSALYLYIRLCLYIHRLPGTVRHIAVHSPMFVHSRLPGTVLPISVHSSMFVHSPSSRYRPLYICTDICLCLCIRPYLYVCHLP